MYEYMDFITDRIEGPKLFGTAVFINTVNAKVISVGVEYDRAAPDQIDIVTDNDDLGSMLAVFNTELFEDAQEAWLYARDERREMN